MCGSRRRSSFVFVVGTGNLGHEYYQLPVLAAARALFRRGGGADVRRRVSAANGRAARRTDRGGCRRSRCWRIISFNESFVVRNFFRPELLDYTPIRAGAAIEQATPRDALVIVVEFAVSDNAANAPMLLYHSRRKGWSFDLRGLTPAGGARSFATAARGTSRRWCGPSCSRCSLCLPTTSDTARDPAERVSRETRLFKLQ